MPAIPVDSIPAKRKSKRTVTYRFSPDVVREPQPLVTVDKPRDPYFGFTNPSYRIGGVVKTRYAVAVIEDDETGKPVTTMVHSRHEKTVNQLLNVPTVSYQFGASVSDRVTDPIRPPQRRKRSKSARGRVKL